MPVSRFVGGVNVVDAAVFADDDDHVLDRRCGLSIIAAIIGLRVSWSANQQLGYDKCCECLFRAGQVFPSNSQARLHRDNLRRDVSRNQCGLEVRSRAHHV
jgi:hypothetical protein